MIKDILKITGIVAVFVLVGYLLTYPYEVELPQDEDMVLNGNILENQSLEEIIKQLDFKNSILYIEELGKTHPEYLDSAYFENANKLYEKYKDKNVKFVYLYETHLASMREQDHIRKWKMFLKKHSYKGYHFLVSKAFLVYTLHDWNEEKLHSLSLSKGVLVTQNGKIDRNVPSILDNPEAVSTKLDSLLKTQNNDTIISK